MSEEQALIEKVQEILDGIVEAATEAAATAAAETIAAACTQIMEAAKLAAEESGKDTEIEKSGAEKNEK